MFVSNKSYIEVLEMYKIYESKDALVESGATQNTCLITTHTHTHTTPSQVCTIGLHVKTTQLQKTSLTSQPPAFPGACYRGRRNLSAWTDTPAPGTPGFCPTALSTPRLLNSHHRQQKRPLQNFKFPQGLGSAQRERNGEESVHVIAHKMQITIASWIGSHAYLNMN